MPLGLEPGAFAMPGDHIAYFWESDDDFVRGVKFLEVGVREGDYAVVFGFDEASRRVIDVLRASNVDTGTLMREERLAIIPGQVDGAAMLGDIATTLGQMLSAGASRLRLLGNIGWGRGGWPAEDEILAFESKVTEAIASLPCVAVCMYDVRALPPHLIVRAGFATHPFSVA